MKATRKPQTKQPEQRPALVKRKPIPRELENLKIYWKNKYGYDPRPHEIAGIRSRLDDSSPGLRGNGSGATNPEFGRGSRDGEAADHRQDSIKLTRCTSQTPARRNLACRPFSAWEALGRRPRGTMRVAASFGSGPLYVKFMKPEEAV
jgi:hypothetical protein